MDAAKRILMVRPSALGDVCRTVPVLASLKRAMPGATIDWVVQDTFMDAIRSHPDLNEPIAFPRRRFASWWRSPAAFTELWRWQNIIRRNGYDIAIDCQGLLRSGLITAFSGAPTRIGHIDAREFAWLACNERVRCDDVVHTVDRMLCLLSAIDIEPVADMRLYTAEDDRAWWDGRRRELQIDDDTPYVVLAPTARWPSKRWPIERWSELLGPLRDMGYARCIVIGAPGEQDQVRPLIEAGGAQVVDLVGQSSVGQTMAVIERAGLLIANDSAPLHMAVGFGVPIVALFGPTDPARVGPYGCDDSVIRKHQPRLNETVHFKDAALGDSLMRLIEVDDVLERARAVTTMNGATAHADVSASRSSA